jgi:hypothetical protein
MNGPLAETAARFVVARLDLAASGEVNAKLDRLYELLFARRPADADRAVASAYLGDGPDVSRWETFVHALLMTNEFVFVD